MILTTLPRVIASRLVIALSIVLLSVPLAQAETEQATAFPASVSFAITASRNTISPFEPVRLAVSLKNEDSRPVGCSVQQDGMPARVTVLIAKDNGTFQEYDQRLGRSEPRHRDISLSPGESTNGEILVLFGGSAGYIFSEPGSYRIQLNCVLDEKIAGVVSNELTFVVTNEVTKNEAIVNELDELAVAYLGLDRDALVRTRRENDHAGTMLVKRIIAQVKPHLVTPERNPSDRQEAELVDSLERLLERYPDSSYAGYIARYLGLVYIKRLEHEASHAGGEAWDAETIAKQPDYPKALKYLKQASESELCPSTTALTNLGRLHAMAKEWNKVDECVVALRTKHVESGGPKLADELARDMNKLRAKLARRESGNK